MAPRRAQPAVPPEEQDVERCLSFVNTLSERTSANPTEKLVSYEALVEWARGSGLVKDDDAARLSARARRRQDEAERVVSHARKLRELLHHTFVATSSGKAPAPALLEELSAALGGWYRHGRLVPCGEALQWCYGGGDDLDRVLWEIARTASRLLTSSRLARIRPCAAITCGWWFLDDSKNGSRRWCDMKICGNREKIRRFRDRQHVHS